MHQDKCLPELVAEKDSIDASFVHAIRLLAEDCNCNPFGSVSVRCNGTGFCKCKEGSAGPMCQECLPGYLWDNGCKSRVCDYELLRCQNGGVCHNNLRCQCPPAYTGLLCEKRRCESDLGGCGDGTDSGQAPLSSPPVHHLLLLLTASWLLREASRWSAAL